MILNKNDNKKGFKDEMKILVIMKVLATIAMKVTVLMMTYGRNSIGRKGCKEIKYYYYNRNVKITTKRKRQKQWDIKHIPKITIPGVDSLEIMIPESYMSGKPK